MDQFIERIYLYKVLWKSNNTVLKIANKKLEKVFVYSCIVPASYNDGASVRVFSNIRAYLDLNYDIEVFYLQN